jgi:hypothetical protein
LNTLASLQREWGISVQPLKKPTQVPHNPYGVMNFILALEIHFRIANNHRQWGCNFKGLSHDRGGIGFSENLRASLFNDDL